MIRAFLVQAVLLWLLLPYPAFAAPMSTPPPFEVVAAAKNHFLPDDTAFTTPQPRIEVARIRSAIMPGVILGGRYDGILNLLQDRYTASGEIDTRLENAARSLIEDELMQAGYPVAASSSRSPFADQLVDNPEPGQFLIGGTITEVKLNSYSSLLGEKTQDERTIRWELFDRTAGKVIYRQTVTGRAEAEGVDNPAATYEAIRNSFKGLLTQADLADFLSQPTIANLPITVPTRYEIAAVSSSETPLSTEQIVSRSIPSIVQIRTPEGRGTGFVVDASGLIMTNHHVVGSAHTVQADLYDGSTHKAQVIKRDAALDVALLRLEADAADLMSLPVCPVSVKVGEDVVAIGNPLALSNSVTQGVVSGIRTRKAHHLIQTDAAVNPGNSGGPLLNRYGAVIGIVTEKIASRGIEGLGFALPIAESLDRLNVKIHPTQTALNSCGSSTMLAVNQIPQ
ncbi:trypsin-like peptidase domain-containing protein [Leptolyngbya sp. FACHB-711]|uniref:trypsin-like peptidase domain-containing protein n=1 Tax=unclassified Leptolyngbya TaxID=2650499 RepID=UPI001688F5C8|nr:trypsin-like peptidase domain-containing protein [Leptolyngbya sp. FACHB-711]MBD1850469.1 trypsin-like peptidase domain-containing protein [Cyanobacteria bacterium FACHB-502]MBD2026029.1 trypsin-like peptidase domain-containing protein [Leptolyngbya sp. FACHB-711]